MTPSFPTLRSSVLPAAAWEEGIRSLWWEKNGSALLFMRSEGWNRENTALYRWRPGSSTAELILRTNDALTGCLHGDGQLICIREDATTPRRIVAIDVGSGQSSDRKSTRLNSSN